MAGKASARDIEAGRAFVRLFLKDDLGKMLAKSLASAGKSLKSFGQSAMSIGVKMQAAGAAIAAPFVYAIKEASDLQETMSKFGVVFGDRTDAVKAWADALAAQLGRSEGEVASFAASLQDLFVPLGFGAGQAEELTKQLVQLAFDLGSFNNMADADVLRDLQAALTGSGEVMKKYGVLVSEAAVKQEILNQGLDPKTATEQQKVMARLNIIMRGTTAAQGDAARTAGGFANQWKGLLGKIKDTAAVVGEALLPAVTTLVGTLKNAISVFKDFAKQNSGFIMAAAGTVAAIIGLGAALTTLGAASWAIGAGLSALASVLGAVLSPVGMLTTALVGGAAAWVTYTESGQAAMQSLVNAVLPMVETIKATFAGIWEAVRQGNWADALAIAFAGLKIVAIQGVEALKGLMGDSLGNIVGLMATGDLAGAWGQTIDGLTLIWESFAKGIVDTFTGAADIIMQTWLKATSWITDKIFDLAKQEGPIGDAMAKILGVDLRKMQEGNDRRAFEAKRQSIMLMEDQLAEAEKAGNAAAAEDLKQRIQAARDQLGSGNYGAGQTEDPFKASKEAARQTLEGQIAGAREALQRARDDAAARQGGAAGRFVGGNAAAGAGLSDAAKKAQAELDALLAKQRAAGLAPEVGGQMAGGGPLAPVGIPGLTPPQSAVRIGPMYSAAAAQAAGQGGAGGGPQEKALGYFQTMTKELRELGLLAKDQTATFAETKQMYERFLAAFQYGG